MITRFGLTLAALILCPVLGAGHVAAADLRLPASPPQQAMAASAALLSWAGPYLGVQGGYLSGRSEVSFPATGEFHFVDPK